MEQLDLTAITGFSQPAHSPESRFCAALLEVVESIQADPVQLRSLVYELARVQLQRKGWQSDPPVNIMEMRRAMLALDRAIEHVEAFSLRQDQVNSLRALTRLLERLDPSLQGPPGTAGDSLLVINQQPR